jgi:predicted ferric reductase
MSQSPAARASRATAESSATRRRKPGPAPRPNVADGLAVLAGLGFGVVLGTVVISESAGSLAAPGGLLTAAARFCGLTGAYLMLIMLVLVARLPWLEASAGQDRLVCWHRRVAPWAFGLIAAHVVLITLGYAQAARTGVLRQLWVFVMSYPDMVAAFAGFGLLVMATVTSVRQIRRRLKYETWWVVHLYLYLGLALASAHQIATGVMFVGHPLTRALWVALWVCTAGMVAVFRLGQPLWRSLRHQLRVTEVREEAPGVVSVICRGRRLDRLAVSGGQFFLWRFLTRDLWWQAHPYSLSALPQPPYLRVTIKELGDQSQAIRWLRPGTRVAIEGPYGAFTRHARSCDRIVLIGAGVGVTPLRALLEDLPASANVVVIVRASSAGDLILRDEIATMVARRGGRLHEITGPRRRVRFDARLLRQLVPDLAFRDIYVCGPDQFAADIVRAARRLGAVQEQIHQEAFGF